MTTDEERKALIEALTDMTHRIRAFALQQEDVDLLMFNTILRCATILYEKGKMEILIDFARRIEHFALAVLGEEDKA